jgi:two-component system cell cycle sensor histidine kinase/response regulator CckA
VDILLLDMVMEDGFDGLDTYREATRIRPDQKAVVANGFPQTERVQTAQALGAGPLVAKPYRIRELARAIRQELDGC